MFFLWGVGGVQGFWSPACLATVVPSGELAFFVARLPFYFSLFSAPIPPTPFPSGEGGEYYFISPGATAPGSPATGWDAALVFLVESRFRRGGVCPVGRLPTLPLWYPAGGLPSLLPACLFTLAYFLPPSPRPPSRREGGDLRFFYARGSAPCIPGAERGAALAEPAKQVPGAGGARG